MGKNFDSIVKDEEKDVLLEVGMQIYRSFCAFCWCLFVHRSVHRNGLPVVIFVVWRRQVSTPVVNDEEKDVLL